MITFYSKQNYYLTSLVLISSLYATFSWSIRFAAINEQVANELLAYTILIHTKSNYPTQFRPIVETPLAIPFGPTTLPSNDLSSYFLAFCVRANYDAQYKCIFERCAIAQSCSSAVHLNPSIANENRITTTVYLHRTKDAL